MTSPNNPRPASRPTDESCLIGSNEHGAWWGPGAHGYTADLIKAGVYTRQRAIEISVRATYGWHRPGQPPPEIPVRREDAQAALSQANTRVQGKW